MKSTGSTTRDNFTPKTKTLISRRVAFLCSNPKCERATIGSQPVGDGSTNIGVAAHISAASVGGPRYDASLSPEERKDAKNGIWLCQSCSKLIDDDERYYTVGMLREWKSAAEEQSFVAISTSPDKLGSAANFTVELDETDRALIQGLGLPTDDDIEAVSLRMLTAAKANVQAFKGADGWPHHYLSLNLRTQNNSGDHALSVAGVAAATAIHSEFSLVAAPGTGKTTTLVQVADEILSLGTVVATVVPLAEWSANTDSIFQSLTRRNAFKAFREQHFMLLAYHGRLVLLLDGWNELDLASQRRTILELNSLRRDYPLLGFVVSTRRQARNVPVSGPMVEIEALSEEQQLEIAKAIRGLDGEALLDQAWRTTGVRDLISIPLYLNVMLTNATSGTLPTTKEEVLRLFVTEHENKPDRAAELEQKLFGFHREFLTALAVEATQTANTIIKDERARPVISQSEDRLEKAGQFRNPPQPSTILDLLVSQHILIRSGSNNGVSFQHQQFQEWYASFEVEQLMLAASSGEVAASQRLAAKILNMPAWEESILFACDRLSREDQTGEKAVAFTIIRSLSIDPMLAAEMIYRASSTVWDLVKDAIVSFADRWHNPGAIDRAVRFMIATGKPEFAQKVWSPITGPDREKLYNVLDSSHCFRPSVLGPDAHTLFSELPESTRKNFVSELVYCGGFDGLELATALAKADPSSTVTVAAIQSLHFRCADRFVTDVLSTASDGVWTLLSRQNYAGEITDSVAAARLRKEHESQEECEPDILTKIDLLLRWESKDPSVAQKIADIIESNDYPVRNDDARWGLHRIFERYPKEISAALINRIKAGRELPYGCEEMLRVTASIDDGTIPSMVIDCAHENRVAEMAAVVVGPKTVTILIDRLLALAGEMQGAQRPINKALRDEDRNLMLRISNSRIESFLLALKGYSDTQNPCHIDVLAGLIARHGKNNDSCPLQAESSLLEPIVHAINSWIEVLLESPKANRHQFAEVARAIERIPETEFVEGLSRLLAEDLCRYKTARQKFLARPTNPIPPEASHQYTNQYRGAFTAIGGVQISQLMEKYLPDLQFGVDAAYVLKAICKRLQNIPKQKNIWFGPNFSEVSTRRKQLNECGFGDTSPQAEAIFDVVEQLIHSDSTEEDQLHAINLAKIALSMPHGDKGAVVNELLLLPQSLQKKKSLLQAFVLAGAVISADLALDGLNEFFEEAKQKTWLLDRQSNGADDWVELMAFSDRPLVIHDVLELVGNRLRDPWRMQRLVTTLGNSPGEQVEQLLFELAERNPNLYSTYEWVKAISDRETYSSAMTLLDLVCSGKTSESGRNIDRWLFEHYFAELITKHPALRQEVIHRYESQSDREVKLFFEAVISQFAASDSLLDLVRGYARDNRPFDGALGKSVKEVVLGKKPLADFGGNAYELYGVDMAVLREDLFAMLDGDPSEASVAEACLINIDELRDEHGRIDSEPRHPNIASGKAWPIVPENGDDRKSLRGSGISLPN